VFFFLLLAPPPRFNVLVDYLILVSPNITEHLHPNPGGRFPRGAPTTTGSMSSASDADTRAADYETVERRYTVAVNLESWELLAMHSLATEESIPRIRLRMMRALVGLPPTDDEPALPASSSTRSRKH